MKRIVVRVDWLDAGSLPGAWYREAETFEPIKASTLGYLVKRTKKKIIIAVSEYEGGYGGLWVIPAAWVVKVTRVKV